MNTVTIELTNKHSFKLLQDLEEMHLIKMLQPKTKANKMAKFWSVLSDKTTNDLHQQVKQMRNEWERDI